MRLKFLRLVWFVLDSKGRKKISIIMVLILANSLLDFVGLASIIPAVIALRNPEIVKSNALLFQLYSSFSFTSINLFILCLLLTIFFLFLIKSVFSIYIVKYNTLKIFEISTRLSKRVLRIIFNKSLLYIRNNNSSNLYRQINSYPTLFGSSILLSLLNLISESVIVVLILISILLYNYKVFLIVVLLNGPIIYLFNLKYRRRIKALGRSINEESISLVKVFYNLVHGFVDIKMRNKDEFFSSTLIGHTEKVNRLTSSSMVLSLLPTRILELNAIFVLVVIYSTTFFVSISNQEVFTIIGFFVIASYRIMPSTGKIMQATLTIKNSIYVLPFLYKILKSEKIESSGWNSVTFKDKISFKNVDFYYSKSGKEVLSDLSFEVAKGEMIGIVGESGAGKSSLVNLLLGFITPTSGTICVDGFEIDSSNINSWRSRIGYVKQDTFMFDGSIAENVSLGEESNVVNRLRVEDCVRKTHLSTFLTELKLGIDSPVGEMGGKISGGQKQRIGIARAIYHDPDILIFDEATSALDVETEREIINEIRELRDKSKSIIIIAHRYSNLKYCDRILKMENGIIKNVYLGFDEFSKSEIR